MGKELEKALYDMVIAYCNKDEELPHSFEIKALENARNLITDRHNKGIVEYIYQETNRKLL